MALVAFSGCPDGQPVKTGGANSDRLGSPEGPSSPAGGRLCEPQCSYQKTCEQGQCVTPCASGCASGLVCNRTKNVCVVDPCVGVSCPTGKVCKGGLCRDPSVKPIAHACVEPARWNPVKLRCEVPDSEGCMPGPGPVPGTIIKHMSLSETRTLLVINKGSQQCILGGMTGVIDGVAGRFTVTEVREFTCKAEIDVAEPVIGAHVHVIINPR